jgi:hypothetical protein
MQIGSVGHMSTTYERDWTINTEGEARMVVDAVVGAMTDHLETTGRGQRVEMLRAAVRTAVDEACQNSIKHGIQLDTSKVVSIKMAMTSEDLLVETHDPGEGFDVDDLPDPTDPENLERPCGRGVMFIKHFTQKTGGSADFIRGNGMRIRMLFKLGETSPQKESA